MPIAVVSNLHKPGNRLFFEIKLSQNSENMKSKSLLLVYDDLCPLCSWYTGCFVNAGLLEPSGRKPFSKVNDFILTRIDFERSKNEIPLIDLSTNQVWYGIDALLEILDQKIPWIKTIGLFRPVKWFLTKLYKLISFNRKVIVARKCGHGDIDCSPEFNLFYRFFFMGLFLFINTVMLVPVHSIILTSLPGYHFQLWELQVAHLGLVASNILLAISLPRKTGVEYLGQVNMLAVITILLLLLLMLSIRIFSPPTWFSGLFLVLSTLFVLKEYFRRMNYAGTIKNFMHVSVINLICLAIFLAYLFLGF